MSSKNKLFIILIALIAILFFWQGKPKPLIIRGSQTMLGVTKTIIKCCYNQPINIDGGNSNNGIKELIAGQCDIAMSSRKINSVERLQVTNAGSKLIEVPVAMDGITVIVHPSNTVKQLSKQQLEDIYSGNLSNWKTITGVDQKIIVAVNDNGATFDLFKEKVMPNKPLTANTLLMPDAIGVTQSVGQMEGAIGFIPFAFKDSSVRVVALDIDKGFYMKPSIENIQNKSYPLSRILYYYYFEKNATRVSPFIQAVTSERGLKSFTEAGFIPLKK